MKFARSRRLSSPLDFSHKIAVTNCLGPLSQANRTRYFHYKGRLKNQPTEAALEIRRDALDIALRIKGQYAPPAVEQAHKHTVQVLVLDVPRPKRDIPPPTMIEIAKPELPPTNGNEHNGNGSSGAKSDGFFQTASKKHDRQAAR